MVISIPNHEIQSLVFEQLDQVKPKVKDFVTYISEEDEIYAAVMRKFSCSKENAIRIWNDLISSHHSLLISSILVESRAVLDTLRSFKIDYAYVICSHGRTELDVLHQPVDLAVDERFEFVNGVGDLTDLDGILGKDGVLKEPVKILLNGKESSDFISKAEDIAVSIFSLI